MKSLEELRELYDNKLKPTLETLEIQRKGLMKRFVLIVVVVIATGLIFFFGDTQPNLTFLYYLIPVGIIALVYLIYKAVKAQRVYRDEFKENVVRAIVQLIDSAWIMIRMVMFLKSNTEGARSLPKVSIAIKGMIWLPG